jgi:hypothetical protein
MLSDVVSVMRLVRDWLRNEHVILADDDLAEMRRFINAVNRLRSLDELVLEILKGIHEKVNVHAACYASLSSVYQALLNLPPLFIAPSPDSATQIGSPTPRQLAMALARLEEELYLRILPIEYTAHVGNLPSYCPNLSAMIDLNRRINYWVQSCILNMEFRGAQDGRERRCENKRYFVRTAKVVSAVALGSVRHGRY